MPSIWAVGCFLNLFQGDAFFGRKPATEKTDQVGYMAAAPKGFANVVGQGTYVSTLPAFHVQDQLWNFKLDDPDVVYLHRTGFSFHFNSGAG